MFYKSHFKWPRLIREANIVEFRVIQKKGSFWTMVSLLVVGSFWTPFKRLCRVPYFVDIIFMTNRVVFAEKMGCIALLKFQYFGGVILDVPY